ncbi:MAG: sulfite exporter TauE/SafE family protein [Deltaproteobacteria bacterium]|nr:MAG: sulfite exporter TauE/SafE family protein [Deltaproteobacteria bacterium]
MRLSFIPQRLQGIKIPPMIYFAKLGLIISLWVVLAVGFFTSALAGYVEWITALIILAGSLLGVQLGVYATKYVTGMKIRVLFAMLVFVVAVSVSLKQMNMPTISSYLVMSAACALCLAILLPLGKNLLHRTTS